MKNTLLQNTKVKREYKRWLVEAKGFSIATIDQMFRAVCLYEEVFQNEDFALYNQDRAVKFKEFLRNKMHGNKKISQNSIRTYLNHLRSFIVWLCTQPGYKKINVASIEYLRVSKKENRIASQSSRREFPMINYIKSLTSSIKINNEIDMRDRALIAFTFLTGMRDAAIISLPLKCVDENKLFVDQNPKMGVNTKFSKSFPSKIFVFDEEFIVIVVDWLKYLRTKGYSSEDPVFPRSKSEQIADGYSFIEATEIDPQYWNTTNSIRKIFKVRSEKASLPYFPPHTFRHSAIYYALKFAKNGEEIKAISQNFGHEDLGTTLSVYANYSQDGLIEVLNNIEYSDKQSITNKDLFDKLEEILKSNKNL